MILPFKGKAISAYVESQYCERIIADPNENGGDDPSEELMQLATKKNRRLASTTNKASVNYE